MNRTSAWKIGLGPVFVYEWITSSRRWQIYALRSLFVTVLLLALVSIWWNTNRTIYVSAIRYLAALGGGFFLAVNGTQLTLVLLAAPAATAGAICLDRARGTLTHMLMTDLSVAEIVLGKLAGRLVPVLTMLACTLPVLEILTLLGGVDPTALLSGFAVSFGVAVLGCSLAMALSLWVGKTHEALLCTYAIWLLWLLAGPMAGMLGSSTGWTWLTVPRHSDPYFLALAPYWWPGSVGLSDYVQFLGVTCSIAAVLIGVTMLRLRAICSHESARTVRRSKAPARGFNIWRFFTSAIPWLTPSLEGNPVVWREWHRGRPSRWMMLVVIVYGGLSLVFTGLAMLWTGGQSGAIVNGFQVAVGLLLLSVTAATSLAEERARGSLDLLLSTPLSTRQIVVGKWLGAFRVVPMLVILPALLISVEIYVADTQNWWLGAMMIAFVLCAGAAITSLGLAMATRFSRVGRAIGMTVTVYVLVTVAWVPFAVLMYGPPSQRLILASPMFWAMMATLGAGPIRIQPLFAGAFFWIIFYALCTAAVLLTTLTSFDRWLGRIDDAASWLCLPSRLVRIFTGLYAGWSLCFALFLFLPSRDPTFTSFGSALLFTLGLLLLAARASWPLVGDRSVGANELQLAARRAPVRLLLAKWASAGRLVPGMLILPLMIAFNDSGAYPEEWAPLVVLLVFMFSVCLAAVSLGVLMFAWLGRSMLAVVITAVVWGISISDWLTYGTASLLGWESVYAAPSLPFSGVAKLCLWTQGTRSGESGFLVWALVASAIYAVVAAVLFGAAVLTAIVKSRRAHSSI
jgi:ABC-type transport system involved in multi-copper enzyme maturation permease subunit